MSAPGHTGTTKAHARTRREQTALELAMAIQERERGCMATGMAELEVAQATAPAQEAPTGPVQRFHIS